MIKVYRDCTVRKTSGHEVRFVAGGEYSDDTPAHWIDQLEAQGALGDPAKVEADRRRERAEARERNREAALASAKRDEEADLDKAEAREANRLAAMGFTPWVDPYPDTPDEELEPEIPDEKEAEL